MPLRFMIVGIWNFIFGYACFALLYWLLGGFLHDAIILALAYILGITCAYISHRIFTYRSEGKILNEYFRFYLVYGVQITLNFVFFLLFVRIFHCNPYMTQAIISLVLVILSYWGHKHFSFQVIR